MGFWKKLFGLESDTSNDNEAQSQEQSNKVVFVTEDEEQSFETSIYGQLQIYGAEIEYIKEVLPERGESLEKQIVLLTRLLEVKNDENDFEVIECFSALKKQYEEDKKMADGEYTIRELESQNTIMDKMFEKSFQNGGITKDDLDKFIYYIGMIQNKVNSSEAEGNPILTKVQRQKFNYISLKSEYRLKMLELMYLGHYGSVEINPFKDLSITKQKIFSNLFWKDAQNAEQQYEYLSYHEDLFNEYDSNYFRKTDRMAQRLNEQIRNVRMVGDFSARQLFDSSMSEAKSFEFLKNFISFKTTLNEMRDRKQEFQEAKVRDDEEKRQQEERDMLAKERVAAEARVAEEKRREELEKLKSMTNSEIVKKIDDINSDLTATGSRFINILEFQKRVAKAKGLLADDVDTQLEELYYKPMGPASLAATLKRANARGVNYIVYPDSQETNSHFVFVVSQSDKDVADGKEEMDLPIPSNCQLWDEKSLGMFDITILGMIANKVKESDRKYLNTVKRNDDNELYDLRIGKNYNNETGFYNAKKRVLEAIKQVQSEICEFASSEEYIQNILCYLQVPAIRNIVPILEKLKAANIEIFLEPVPEETRNDTNRENLHIYFKREDLEMVQDIVRDSPELGGSVGIKADKQIIGELMKKRAIWPVEKEK